MLPYIHLGFLNVPTFGLMLWLAAVTAGLVMDRNFRRNKISADAVGMVAVTVVAGMGGQVWRLDAPSGFVNRAAVLWDTAGLHGSGGVFGISALLLGGWRAVGPLRTLDLAAAAAIRCGMGASAASCQRRLLESDQARMAVGYELSQRDSGRSTRCRCILRRSMNLPRGWLSAHGSGFRRQARPAGTISALPDFKRINSLFVEFIRRNPRYSGAVDAQLASTGSVIASTAILL
jgi:phosphatidylglycerol:prolipoprotein diacylglycerol transferase